MVRYSLVWSCIFWYGHVWSFIVPYAPVWTRMALCGPIWSLKVPYGSVWFHMVPYGSMQSSMVPYGPLCFLMQHMIALFQLTQLLHKFCACYPRLPLDFLRITKWSTMNNLDCAMLQGNR